MHKTAEYGIAAHWKYKEASDGKKINTGAEEEKLSWLRQILEWQRDMSDNREFMNLLKSDLDLFSDSVYCFTPTGDVKNLPAGSTPVSYTHLVSMMWICCSSQAAVLQWEMRQNRRKKSQTM